MSTAGVRPGSTLVELLVSLPLAMLVAAAAALLLVRVARSSRAQSSVLTDVRELRHGRLVLLADLQPVGGSDLHVVTDSLLEFRGYQGVLTLCGHAGGGSLIVAVPPASGDSWLAAVRAGDGVTLWQQAGTVAPPRSLTSTVRLPPSPQDVAPCLGGPASAVSRRWRLTIADTAHRLVPGTPVVVTRDVRFRHYRAGARWWLGRQSRDGSGWETTQPVAGPLRPAGLGMRVRARTETGAAWPFDPAAPDSVKARIRLLDIMISMARQIRDTGAIAIDSVAVLVPLRGGRASQ